MDRNTILKKGEFKIYENVKKYFRSYDVKFKIE